MQTLYKTRSTKTSKSMFFGLTTLLMVALLSLGACTNSKAYINEPLVGDLYEVELENNEFSVMKVAVVTADSVYFVHHEYNTDGKDGIADLLKTYPNDYFSEEDGMDVYTREKLLELLTDGGILKVRRPAAVTE